MSLKKDSKNFSSGLYKLLSFIRKRNSWVEMAIKLDKIFNEWILIQVEITKKNVIFSYSLVRDFANIYKCQLTGYYIWSISTICSSLLSIQMDLVRYSRTIHFQAKNLSFFLFQNQSQNNGNFFGMINPFIVIFRSTAILFVLWLWWKCYEPI